MVAEGRLDLAAMVIGGGCHHSVHDAIDRHDLDVASPREIEGLVKRHPWLDLGHIPAGRYDLERPVPPVDRQVAHVDTLVVTGPCARRSERVALLTLLSAELPGFVRSNPPEADRFDDGTAARAGSTAVFRHRRAATGRPLFPLARQPDVAGLLGLSGDGVHAARQRQTLVQPVPAVADRYGAGKAKSPHRPARQRSRGRRLRAKRRAIPNANAGTADSIMQQLAALRARCHGYTRSIFMPMGDELYYRYQESMIEELMERLAALQRGAGGGGMSGRAAVERS